MTTATPHMVIGRVGFAANGEFIASPADASDLVAELEAQVDELIGQVNQLRAVLQKCAALTPQISDAKHEALLATDPKNLHPRQENFLP
jgi:hypothetical protein